MDTITRGTLPRLLSNDDACYLFDRMEFQKNISSMNEAFKGLYSNFQLSYSFKTNYLVDICRTVNSCGGFAEVVSRYEYWYARKIGFPDNRIVFNGVDPCPELKVMAAENGCIVNVDNYHELCSIVTVAEQRNSHIKIGLRVNFSIMNGVKSRFGIDVEEGDEMKKCLLLLNIQSHVKLGGIHCHIGSSRPLKYWAMKAAKMAWLAREFGAEYVDLGGGMYGPMPESLAKQFEEYEPSYEKYAEEICGYMKKFFPNEECRLMIEPGTALVGNTMEMVATVTGIKQVRGKWFVTVNCNSNHLGVIADMKELPIDVIHLSPEGSREKIKDAVVCGNTCLEYDYLSRNFSGELSIGDRLVFKNVGAYSISSSRQFIVPRPEVREKDTGEVLRPAETEEDIFRIYFASCSTSLDS